MVNGAIRSITVKEDPNNWKIGYQIIKYLFFTIFSLILYKIRLGLNLDIKQWA
jgi:hypothetical protein